ncbi:MAG: SET domain-containing protein-lysine N-methyltransferase [Candidatus Eremiobacterota bacterium]
MKESPPVFDGLVLLPHPSMETGKGVFTTADIPAWTHILTFRGPELTLEELDDPDHSIQVGRNLFLGPYGGIDDYVNHSCDPNCGLRLVGGELRLYAIRAIQAGEELTFDYATCVGPEDPWTMECLCGTARCRGHIAGYSILPEDFRRRYEELDIVPWFVR